MNPQTTPYLIGGKAGDGLGLGKRNQPRSMTMTVVSSLFPPLIVLYVLGAIGSVPAYDYARQFGEGGMIAAASSLMLAAAALAAVLNFYIRRKLPHGWRIHIWLAVAAGLAFMALDDLAAIPGLSAAAMPASPVSMPAQLSGWFVFEVAMCTLGGVAAIALFAREFWRPALVLEFLVAGFTLYGIHLGIETWATTPTAFSLIVDESARLLASSQFMLAMMAACIDQIDEHFAPGRPMLDWLLNTRR